MTDRDRFDRELPERLRSHEERAPGGVAPQLTDEAPRRGWAPLALVGAAGLVVGAVLVGVLLQRPQPPTGEGTPSPSASADASASAGVDVTPTPMPTAAPSATAIPTSNPDGVWTSGTIEIPDDSGNGPYLSGVRWFSGIGWLAFGQGRATEAADAIPAFWYSPDGMTWTRSTTPPGLEGFAVADLEVGDLRRGPRLVAVTTDFQRSRLLISDDGRAWSQAQTPTTAAVISAVAFGDRGFVAVGTDRYWAGTEQIAGVVWHSADGLSWQATTPAALNGAVPVTVEAISGRGYLAVGRIDGEAPPRTLAWTSPDGESWQSSVIRPAQDQGGSLAIVSGSDGSLVMVAGVDPDLYAGWSIDGDAWSFESLPVAYADPTAIDVSPQAIVMVAFLYIADGPSDSYVWVRDLPGDTWRTVDWRSHVAPGEDFAGATGVATGPSGTLILFANGRVLLTDGPLR